MQTFITKSTPGHHRAFNEDFKPITKDCRTEVDLAQELRKLGIHLKDYSYEVRPADGPFHANTIWMKK